MPPKVLAKVIRGETVESVHRGHLIVSDGRGETLLALGDPNAVTYFRSASKPFQALPCITTGAADAFHFSEEEIALACASHSGESRHVRIARLMLERIGLSEAHLHCGAHLPFSEKESERMLRAGEHATALHNNCSGKHAAMLALAKHIGADVSTYELLESPVQQMILDTVARFCELPSANIKIGIDGCVVPNFAMPLANMARGFMNLMRPDAFDETTRSACARIVSAMVKFPELIGGTERLDTMLMQAAPGRIISKVGADGVWLCGVLPGEQHASGIAIALKIEDGDDSSARPVAAVAVLKKLGILPADALPDLSPMPLTNRRGDIVGEVRAELT
jgi:L-asparaginase II